MSIRLVESFLTTNPCCAMGWKIMVKGLMLHSVGCPQLRAFAFIRSWDSPVHGGSGNKGSGNNTHIGVEMCGPACIRYTAGSNFVCSDLV